MRLSGHDLRARTVISADGQAIGDIASLFTTKVARISRETRLCVESRRGVGVSCERVGWTRLKESLRSVFALRQTC